MLVDMVLDSSRGYSIHELMDILEFMERYGLQNVIFRDIQNIGKESEGGED